MSSLHCKSRQRGDAVDIVVDRLKAARMMADGAANAGGAGSMIKAVFNAPDMYSGEADRCRIGPAATLNSPPAENPRSGGGARQNKERPW